MRDWILYNDTFMVYFYISDVDQFGSRFLSEFFLFGMRSDMNISQFF